MLLGAPFALRCIWDFAWSGEGTPAPFDPPRKLVVSGLYRWVRNPMYLSFGVVFVGEALLLPAVTRELLLFAPIAWLFFTAFVMLYNWSASNVRRWLPRVRPFAVRSM